MEIQLNQTKRKLQFPIEILFNHNNNEQLKHRNKFKTYYFHFKIRKYKN